MRTTKSWVEGIVRIPIVVVLLALSVSGCFGAPAHRAGQSGSTVPPDSVLIGCRVLDEERNPLVGALCHYEFDRFQDVATTDETGYTERWVPLDAQGRVWGEFEGRQPKSASIFADAPKTVEMVLEQVPAGETAKPLPSSSYSTRNPLPPPPNSTGRQWDTPVQIDASGDEPQISIDSKGTIYYAPSSELYRSTDGGKTFGFLPITGALPTIGSDDALYVAPDDSVWYSRYWGYAGGTLGCTSKDRGDAWTCDNSAIPGATDRMWIVGVNNQNGYVQAAEGLQHPVWASTSTGSTKYVPYASSSVIGQIGNMVYDAKNKAVWQIGDSGGNLELWRVDGVTSTGLISPTSIPVPSVTTISWMAVHDGVLWTTGESNGKIVAARSTDQGRTWAKFTVSSAPKEATFSYIAAGPNGRAAVVYYGSDASGAPIQNTGHWSLFVSETDDALAAHPTWVESRLVANVHKGEICADATCQTDPGNPRFAGDLIGIAIDADGNAHVAYMVDAGGSSRCMYVRESVG